MRMYPTFLLGRTLERVLQSSMSLSRAKIKAGQKYCLTQGTLRHAPPLANFSLEHGQFFLLSNKMLHNLFSTAVNPLHFHPVLILGFPNIERAAGFQHWVHCLVKCLFQMSMWVRSKLWGDQAQQTDHL